MQFLGQVYTFEQASPCSYKDWMNDNTIFIHQAKLDELGGDIDAAGQNIFAWFLFQFEDFVAEVSTHNACTFVFDAVERS